MPRSGKGGSRQGTPGTAYSNRTDLNVPKTTVPNQEYGKATEQMSAQSAIPMAQSPVAQGAAPAQQTAGPMPGSLPFLHPTERPTEPIQAGITSGPGPGPEAIAPQPRGILSEALRHMSNDPNATAGTFDLAAHARLFGM
jgi:hypothetical protein